MYAKLISTTSIDRKPPRQAVIDGRFVTGELPEAYLNSQNWYRLEETPMPEPQDGYHAEPRYAYDSDEAPTRIVQSWEVVQDPPTNRELSRVKLYRKFRSMGIWEQVKDWMQSKDGVWEEWEYSTTLDENNELVVDAKAALRDNFGLTDDEIEGIVSESVAE